MSSSKKICIAIVSVLMLAGVMTQGYCVEAGDFDFDFYGYVKLDAAYDTQTTTAGDLMFFVNPEVDGDSDNQFNMTAKETRVGTVITGPDIGDTSVKARLEADFYGPGGTDNSPNLRLRRAYVELANPNGWGLLAGQEWETFITVIPRVINFSYLADAGALGLRRPQVRVTKKMDCGLTAKLAITRTIGQDTDDDGADDGEDAGIPSLQYNLCYKTAILTEKDTKISVSGHYGKETINVDDNDDEDLDSWSVIGSLYMPIIESVTLQGTIWTGTNLDTYFGGIGQGVNASFEEIEAVGGFAQLLIKLTEELEWNLGFGMDDPKDEDLDAGARSLNTTFFTSAFYHFSSALSVGVEYQNMKTEYKDADDATNNRVQGAIIYKF